MTIRRCRNHAVSHRRRHTMNRAVPRDDILAAAFRMDERDARLGVVDGTEEDDGHRPPRTTDVRPERISDEDERSFGRDAIGGHRSIGDVRDPTSEAIMRRTNRTVETCGDAADGFPTTEECDCGGRPEEPVPRATTLPLIDTDRPMPVRTPKPTIAVAVHPDTARVAGTPSRGVGHTPPLSTMHLVHQLTHCSTERGINCKPHRIS